MPSFANLRAVSLLGALCIGAWGCTSPSDLPSSATYGPNPTLPKPTSSLLPRANVPKFVGWPSGQKPTAPAGFAVNAFADKLDHPRRPLVLPNGDVLVAESSSEPIKEDSLMARAANALMRRAGAMGTSANRVTLLRDQDGDGRADLKTVLIGGLNQPFGLAVAGGRLYIGNTDAVVSVPFVPGQTRIDEKPQVLVKLPHNQGGHWTRDLLVSPDGTKLYVGVGSATNVADAGMALEAGRARILEIQLSTGQVQTYAEGLRNPNGLTWSETGELWTVVNERDELGNDLVPDYMTSVRRGGFYGWPYSYFGNHVDARVKPQRPDLVARAIVPDYALGAHTASLGLAFYAGAAFPERYRGGAFVGQHGSWNRNPVSGYKVVFIPFKGGRPDGVAEDFLTGFLSPKGQVWGRPVGVAVAADGALLVADDSGNTLWRVAPTAPAAPSAPRTR